MRFFFTVNFAVLISSVFAANIVVQVGGAVRVFNPSHVAANSGDTIAFQFLANSNHSATQSTFDNPCSPAGVANSGFIPVPDGPNQPSIFWNFTVTDTAPLWFFCAQTVPSNHCQQLGMVFAVNANDQSFADFRARAISGQTISSSTSTTTTSTTSSTTTSTTSATSTTSTTSTSTTSSAASSAASSITSKATSSTAPSSVSMSSTSLTSSDTRASSTSPTSSAAQSETGAPLVAAKKNDLVGPIVGAIGGALSLLAGLGIWLCWARRRRQNRARARAATKYEWTPETQTSSTEHVPLRNPSEQRKRRSVAAERLNVIQQEIRGLMRQAEAPGSSGGSDRTNTQVLDAIQMLENQMHALVQAIGPTQAEPPQYTPGPSS